MDELTLQAAGVSRPGDACAAAYVLSTLLASAACGLGGPPTVTASAAAAIFGQQHLVWIRSLRAKRSAAQSQEELADDIRVTTISPGTTTSELADHITDADAAEAMKAFRDITIEPEFVARAIAFAIQQPQDVDVSEIVVRPTRSPA